MKDRSVAADRGDAVLEFIVIAVAVLVPLAYVVMAVMTVQSASVASAHAVREASRAIVLAANPGEGLARADAAARLALADQGFDLPVGALAVDLGSGGPGASVHVSVHWRVPLPFMPAWGGLGSVPVGADHVAQADEHGTW